MKDICPNLHNKQVAQEYGELEDLFGPNTAHLLWSRNNGHNIDKAPNGADSILFGELLHITNGDRTRAIILKSKIYSEKFLKWFGDWTSDNNKNVSKVVDRNGEPQATYHTVSIRHNPNFKKFDTNIEGFKTAIYHTDSIDMSISYNRNKAENYEEIKHYDISIYNKYKKIANEEIFEQLNDINKDDFLDERNYDWFLKKKEEFLYYIKNKELGNAEYILNSFRGLLKKNKEKSVLVNGPFDDYFETFYQSKLDDLEHSFYTLYDAEKNNNPYDIERKLQNETFDYTKIDFLNIKNPKIVDAKGRQWDQLEYQGDLQQSKQSQKKYEDALESIAILAYGNNKIDNSMSDLYQQLNNITLLNKNKANAVLKRVYDLTKIKLNLNDFQIMYEVDSTRTLERFLGKYDGVIINNVIDYGSSVEQAIPHTVYECIDNSQVKSVFNNGKFANPDDMYASSQGESNMGAATRLSNIPSSGDISILQKYLKSHRNGVSSTALKLVMAAVNRYFNDKQTGIT